MTSQSASKAHRYSRKARIAAIAGSSAMAVLGILCVTVSVLLFTAFGRIHFSPDEPYDPNIDIPTPEPDEEDNSDAVVVDPDEYNHAHSVSEIPLRGNEKGIRNILLLGIDSQTFSGRSDTTMILSVNDNTRTIKLVSLLRDTWVTIPGRDKDKDGKDDIGKLNAAYAYGRHDLQHKMLMQNFRLDISDYIGVNFKVLPIVIDAVGGLDVELTAKEMTQIPAANCKVEIPTPGRSDQDGIGGFTSLKGSPGVHHLNGFQAMQYARIRKIDSDFKRTERQRRLVSLVIEKAKKMSYTQLAAVVYKALSYVDTNMSADELLGFAAGAVKYTSYTVDMSYHVPQAGAYKSTKINGGAGLLMTDAQKSVKELHEFLYS